jgi:symplekin
MRICLLFYSLVSLPSFLPSFIVALQSLDVLATLLNDASNWTVKVAVQTFAGVYPLLFRRLCVRTLSLPPNHTHCWVQVGILDADVLPTYLCRCTNRNERPLWDTLTRAKNRIIELMWAPNTQVGIQFASVKFLQRVILVQSRGVADPRVSRSIRPFHVTRPTECPCPSTPSPTKLQNKNDPNLAVVPGDHPFINAAALETEGVTLLQRLITDLYTKQCVMGSYVLTNSLTDSWPYQEPRPYLRHPE